MLCAINSIDFAAPVPSAEVSHRSHVMDSHTAWLPLDFDQDEQENLTWSGAVQDLHHGDQPGPFHPDDGERRMDTFMAWVYIALTASLILITFSLILANVAKYFQASRRPTDHAEGRSRKANAASSRSPMRHQLFMPFQMNKRHPDPV